MVPKLKVCKRCPSAGRPAEQPLSAFNRASESPDGLQWICRLCQREAAQRQREKNRQERAASDYEPLTTEDFAVGVGNVPGEGPRSARAGVEKRQEYNRKMGDTLAAVHEVAAGEASDLPQDVTEYLAILSEQERRFGNRRLARSTAIALAHEMLGIRMFKRAAEQYLSNRIEPAGYAARKRPAPEPGTLDRTLCVGLSDLHLGAELSDVDNPQPFRRLEESRRLAYVIQQACEYKQRYRDRTRLKLLINGDVIQGMLLHDLRDGAPLTEQMVVFWRLLSQAIALLAAQFPLVEVHLQPGNHGRDKLRHPGRATSFKWDGHEWRMYYALSMMASGLPNVTFDLPFRAVSLIDLYGRTLGMTHGDTEVPLGNPTTQHDRNVAELQKINATRSLGREVDAWFVGHFHSAFLAPGVPTVVYNGMLVPPDGHARTHGYIGKPCGQWIWEAVAGYPVGDARFVNVGPQQDQDETLDSVLTPPKFG